MSEWNCIAFILAQTPPANGGPHVETIWTIFERFGPAGAVIMALIAAAKWFATRFDKLTDRHFSYLDKTTEIAEGTRDMVSALASETKETKEVSQRIALSQNETSRALRGVRRSMESQTTQIEAQTEEIKKIPDAVHQEGRATVEAIARSSETHVKNIIDAVNHGKQAERERPK